MLISQVCSYGNGISVWHFAQITIKAKILTVNPSIIPDFLEMNLFSYHAERFL